MNCPLPTWRGSHLPRIARPAGPIAWVGRFDRTGPTLAPEKENAGLAEEPNRRFLYGCGAPISTVPLTPYLLVSAEISAVRGVSSPERLVRVHPPRWITAAELPGYAA